MATFTDIKVNPQEIDKSVQWYQAQIKKLGAITGSNIMKERQFLTTKILPGKMYLFYYDPKHKSTLPYYDAFPLVLPYRKVTDGFFGLNLHYLPYMTRFKLLGYLSDYLNNDKMDDTTRLILSWRILSNSTKLSPVKACVKHYLSDFVQSRFFEIPIENWITASLLPIDKFVGANKNQVWQDSRKKF